MSLPNAGMSFTPFDPLTAAEQNDLVENIEALAAGTGLDNSVVTPDKRTGGFKIGTMTAATFGSTGNKAVTGVGFTPKLVRFTVLPGASASVALTGSGAMTASNQYAVWATANASSGNAALNSYTTSAVAHGPSSSSTATMRAAYVSMGADGFTINVTTANASYDVGYEAYG